MELNNIIIIKKNYKVKVLILHTTECFNYNIIKMLRVVGDIFFNTYYNLLQGTTKC